MAKKLNEFISLVKNTGLAKNNLFEVEFFLPETVRNKLPNSNLRNILLFCDSALLPGINISTNQVRTYGELRETPYEKLFDNIQLTFYIDNSYEVKTIFDQWINSIQDQDSREFNYYNNYITDIVIKTLDRQDKVRYSVKLYECYIKSIEPIQLDYSSIEVSKLSVSINYKYWKPIEYANDQSSKVFSPEKEFSFFSEQLRIPEDYFTDFTGFQQSIPTFIESDLINTASDSISGVKSDIVKKISDVKANIPKFDDNKNFDFKL